jgi:hypothetical protein
MTGGWPTVVRRLPHPALRNKLGQTIFVWEDAVKELGLALIILAVGAGSAAAADSPFAGTWKENVEKSKLTGDTFTYAKTARGYQYSNGTTVTYVFAIDGKDYPMLADRTVAWTAAGENAWDSVTKAAGGVVLSKTHRVLSPDGKEITSTVTIYRPDGTTEEETDVLGRVGAGHGLAGEWKIVKTQVMSDTMTIAVPSGGRFELAFPSFQETIAGATDGTASPVKGPTIPAGLVARYKAVGPGKWEYSTSLKGKVYARGTLTVSGATLTRTSWIPGKETEKSIEVYDKQ